MILLECLYHALVMAWETFWALVLGFLISGMLQVFVSKTAMTRTFGRTNLKSMAMATFFGAASSSCSYAAAAAGRSAFKQGAALTVTLAFMFASTNLVAELGAVLWLLLGWRFLLANIAGAFLLIALVWVLSRFLFRKIWRRKRAIKQAGKCSCRRLWRQRWGGRLLRAPRTTTTNRRRKAQRGRGWPGHSLWIGRCFGRRSRLGFCSLVLSPL